jgi:hypothetical protein
MGYKDLLSLPSYGYRETGRDADCPRSYFYFGVLTAACYFIGKMKKRIRELAEIAQAYYFGNGHKRRNYDLSRLETESGFLAYCWNQGYSGGVFFIYTCIELTYFFQLIHWIPELDIHF